MENAASSSDHPERVIDGIVGRGSNVQAHRIFELVRAMLRWGIKRDHVKGEPWRGVELPPGSQPRERVLTAAEIRWLWQETERWTDNVHGQRVLRLQILLGQRSGEIAGMQCGEVAADLMTWSIPGARTKNGEPHTVPLPPLARQLLREALADAQGKSHVFLGERGKPYRSDTVAHDLARAITAFNEHASEPVERFKAHDLRRTVATGMERMGISMNIISAVLNHISGKQPSEPRRVCRRLQLLRDWSHDKRITKPEVLT